LEIICEMRWRWNRMTIAGHRNRKGNDMVRVDNM